MDQQSEMPLAAEPVTSMEDETRKKPTSPKQERMHKVQKVLQTLVLYVGFFSIGLMASVIGPTLLDLQRLTHTTIESFAIIFPVRAVIGLSGAILGGLLVTRVHYWMLLGVMMSVVGVAIILMPHMRHLATLGLFMSISYWAGFLFNAAGNLVLLKVWEAKNGPWMQALHCIFGTGALIGPLVAIPFLSSESSPISSTSDNNASTSMENVTIIQQESSNIPGSVTTSAVMENGRNQTAEDLTEYESQIHWAYLIIGLCACLSAILFLLITLFCSNLKLTCLMKQQKLLNNEGSPNDADEKKDKAFRIKLSILLFFFYFCYCILEMNIGTYLTAYAVKELGWTEQQGASVTSVYWTTFTIGRALGIVLIKVLPPWVLLTGDLTISALSLLFLFIFSKHHFMVLWICAPAMGLGFATIFPTGITWTQQYIPVSGILGTVFMIAGSVGEMVGPAVIGLLFDKVGPKSFLYVLSFAMSMLVTLFVILQCFAMRHGKRQAIPPSIKESMKEDNDISDGLMVQVDKAATTDI